MSERNYFSTMSRDKYVPKWMEEMDEDQLMAMLMEATADVENPVNKRPSAGNLVDCGVQLGKLTSMCFWLCLARALNIEPAFIVESMGITTSHPASDDEIKGFIQIFPASITVYEPGETRRYRSPLPEAQHVEVWLEHGHYKLIRR